ncbi:MAG TPA: hypothetical protein VFC53_12470 [Dehalococcoidia bacterium]|nr:hypothetical protein [Dehalococcoidia bacterium]
MSAREETPLARAFRRLFARDATPADEARMSAPAFRAAVAARLRALERDVAEVRARVNGLLFVVAGAVITQLVLRLLG